MNRMSRNKKVVSVLDLEFFYSEKSPIFRNVSFDIFSGELVAVVGPNGTGKSTLVRLICGLEDLKSGKIEIFGKVSYIPQKFNQDSNFPAKVSELLDLECCRCDLRSQVVSSLNVGSFLDKQFKDLSGGQQQRVLIALSLLSNPDVLILDEPTVGIDLKTEREFYRLLSNLNRERGLSIIFVTHDTGMVSDFFDRILVVHNKHVCLEDAKKMKKFESSFMVSHHKNFHNLSSGGQKND